MLSFYLAILETEVERHKFTDIYEQYHVKLENVAMHILSDQKDAEDAVHNAFMQIIRHFEKVSEISCEDLPFWLISIVKNEALMILRKKARMIPIEDWEGKKDWGEVAQSAEDITSYRELVELFTKLPHTYRMILEMKIFYGYSDREISKRLDISETAVSTRASRGRALLQKIMEREGFTQ